MSTKKIDVSDYVVEARRLAKRFPALAKFKRRRTLKPHEKGQITRSANIARVMRLPRDERPEKLQNYRFPGDRIRTDAQYKKIARNLVKFDTGDSLKNILKNKGKLTPSQKGVISRKHKAMPFTDAPLVSLTKSQAQKLPDDIVKGGDGIAAVKMRNVVPSRIKAFEVSKDGVINMRYSRRNWSYISVPNISFDDVSTSVEELTEAATWAFENGAAQINFWTAHGRAGDAYSSLNLFGYALENQYMRYLEETAEANAELDEDYEEWLVGIAVMWKPQAKGWKRLKD